MADIIDNAAEIEELQRNLSLQNTNPIVMPHLLLIVASVAIP